MAKKSGKSPSKKSTKHVKPVKAIEVSKISSRNQALSKSRRIKSKPPGRFSIHKKIKHPVKLPSIFRIIRLTALTIWEHRGLFIGLTIVYGLLNLVLVQGLASHTDINALKSQLDKVSSGGLSSIFSGLSVFTVLLGSAGNGSSQTAGAYQLFLDLIVSLAIIWSLRQVMAGHNISVKDAYYRGMYPLIPFVLVLIVIGIQLIPLLIGSLLYSTVINNGIAIAFIEKFIFILIFAVLALTSLYLISSSLFALYIVTLPDMTPIKALKSARKLVRYRRWTVLRKILALPVILVIVAAIIMLPIILIITPVAQWVFFLLTMFALVAVHSYMYILYRELLNE